MVNSEDEMKHAILHYARKLEMRYINISHQTHHNMHGRRLSEGELTRRKRHNTRVKSREEDDN